MGLIRKGRHAETEALEAVFAEVKKHFGKEIVHQAVDLMLTAAHEIDGGEMRVIRRHQVQKCDGFAGGVKHDVDRSGLQIRTIKAPQAELTFAVAGDFEPAIGDALEVLHKGGGQRWIKPLHAVTQPVKPVDGVAKFLSRAAG